MDQHALSAIQRRIHAAAIRLFAERGVAQVTVSELADYAGMARGTIYNNVPSLETLFEEVASHLAWEMNERIVTSFHSENPAERLAMGVRAYLRRAHEEPEWGRFIARFAQTTASLRMLVMGEPAKDVCMAMKAGHFRLSEDQIPTVVAMVGSAVIGAIYLVREGVKTWRSAGSEVAEFLLRALGIDEAEAKRISQSELPPLQDIH
ncbi:MAG: TetR family transcriptional regulator [Thalassobium sp.]|nr:MAG: TetR family transcriptional regulator [Thalassobium sp.]PIQ40530.1 MAG: TetR family transcriptional regulator [Thalassolituus sp. CG17_big_fil_post_rev_8_21_14_2_50_53_8]